MDGIERNGLMEYNQCVWLLTTDHKKIDKFETGCSSSLALANRSYIWGTGLSTLLRILSLDCVRIDV